MEAGAAAVSTGSTSGGGATTQTQGTGGAQASGQGGPSQQGSQSSNGAGATGSQSQGPKGLDSGKAPTAGQAQALRELAASDMDAVVTVKINGQEKKVPVKDVVAYYRLDNAANQKMEEASKLRKQTEAEKAAIKQDIDRLKQFAKQKPKDFVKLFGINPEEFAEMTLAEKYQLMQMSPAERRAMELEAENKAYKEREQKEAEQQKLSAQQKQEFEAAQNISKELVEAMESPEWKGSGLPADKKFTAFIAQEMLMSEQQKRAGHREQALSAKEAAANVKQYVLGLQKMIADQASAEALYNMIGEQNMKKLREYELNRVTGKTAPTVNSISRPGEQPASQNDDRPKKAMTEDEWRAWMRAR